MIRQPPSFAAEKTSSSQIGVEDFWWRDFCLFGLSVVFPSIAIFKKVGWVPLAGYVFIAMSGMYILLRHVLPAIAFQAKEALFWLRLHPNVIPNCRVVFIHVSSWMTDCHQRDMGAAALRRVQMRELKISRYILYNIRG